MLQRTFGARASAYAGNSRAGQMESMRAVDYRELGIKRRNDKNKHLVLVRKRAAKVRGREKMTVIVESKAN